jgi:three-Cys-motif partner protein
MLATQRAGGSAYIDPFAGPGQVRLPTGVVIDGSPLVAAKASPPFSRLFWSDSRPSNTASLGAHRADFPSRNITVLEGDANVLIDDILAKVSHTQPALVFLDPEGSELAWETVRKIAVHKLPPHNKIEEFILFATDAGIVRFFPRDPTKPTYSNLIDRMLPDPAAWRALYALRKQLDPAEFRRRLVGLYVSGLKQLGYRHVPEPRLVCRPDGRPLYFMVFATDHDAGERAHFERRNHAVSGLDDSSPSRPLWSADRFVTSTPAPNWRPGTSSLRVGGCINDHSARPSQASSVASQFRGRARSSQMVPGNRFRSSPVL